MGRYDYVWTRYGTLDERAYLQSLPEQLMSDLVHIITQSHHHSITSSLNHNIIHHIISSSIHHTYQALLTHINVLRRVRLFSRCDEYVLRVAAMALRQRIYSPGDFIILKGEIGLCHK